MPSLLSMLVEFWPVITALSPILFGAALLYLRTQFPTKAGFDALVETVNGLSKNLTATTTAVDHLTQGQDSAPTRVELMGQIAALSGRVSAVERGLSGIEAQLHTTNDYLKILVDRGLER